MRRWIITKVLSVDAEGKPIEFLGRRPPAPRGLKALPSRLLRGTRLGRRLRALVEQLTGS